LLPRNHFHLFIVDWIPTHISATAAADLAPKTNVALLSWKRIQDIETFLLLFLGKPLCNPLFDFKDQLLTVEIIHWEKICLFYYLVE